MVERILNLHARKVKKNLAGFEHVGANNASDRSSLVPKRGVELGSGFSGAM